MSDRVNREIEEILKKYDDSLPSRKPRKLRPGFADRLKARIRRLGYRLTALSGGQLMLAGVIAILFGYFFSAFLPDAVERTAIIGGVVVFVIGLAIAFVRNRRPARNEVRWRGRVIRLDDNHSLRSRMRGWFNRRDEY